MRGSAQKHGVANSSWGCHSAMLKPSGDVALDPDEGVQRAIRLVFAVFERRRSISGVLGYLVDHDIQLPDRIRNGPNKGDVYWNCPNRVTLSDMLRHPAYVFGRFSVSLTTAATC
ncbi:hypothetical protein [Phyllobacterium phragmitis]|uniref:hypothetical protein n=1 Tax=Phyllobacterium phragmitis TaxID=2670329 RepID=UPI0018EAF7E1|nr:hypothetical protein [Phyllobacterium phragmitis]